jgi:serine protease Do
MRRFQVIAMGGAVLLSGWMVTEAARAADEGEKAVRRPGRRVDVMRMLGGGGRLGVSLEEVGADDVGRLKLAGERGAVVTEVQEGSAAEKAGIKEGDVIVRFGGQDVWSAAQLARLVRETPPNRTLDVEVSRGGSVERLAVTLAKPDRDRLVGPGALGALGENFHFEMPDVPEFDVPVPPMPPMPPAFHFGPGRGRRLGLSYQELGDQLARYFKVEGGVLVTDVAEDGPAAKAGIKAGDVIVRFGGKAVKDGGDLHEALGDAEAGSNATIGVQRDGRAMDLTVTLGDAGPARSAPAARARRRGSRT